MKKLINNKPKRFFAFGSSFTKWITPTWADIISYDLGVEYYNYGKGGAGNEYIFNTIMQADCIHHFNEDDLIIVQWACLLREDRYKDKNWYTPGNIYSQGIYNQKFIKEWANIEWYAIRDFPLIKATWDILNNRNCQFHFIKADDFTITDEIITSLDTDDITRVEKFYEECLSKVERSYFDILWNKDRDYINQRLKDLIHPLALDTHPLPSEHIEYLRRVFDYTFSEKTLNDVEEIEQQYIKNIKNLLQIKNANIEEHFRTTNYRSIFKEEDISLL